MRRSKSPKQGVRHVLGLLRQRFNYVVVDLPMPLAPAIHPVIALSRHVLVLLEAEVTGLRNANALRAIVTAIAGKNRVFTLLNRANRAGGLPMATIAKALGGMPDMVIPDLGKGMTEAVNLGIPALRTCPNCGATWRRSSGRSRRSATNKRAGSGGCSADENLWQARALTAPRSLRRHWRRGVTSLPRGSPRRRRHSKSR